MTIFDRRILGLGAVLAGSLAWTVAWSQSQQVDVEIVNRAFQAIDVEVYDVVCQQAAYTGQILDNASIMVAACPNQDGLATLTVADRVGHSNTFTGLADPSTVTVEFD